MTYAHLSGLPPAAVSQAGAARAFGWVNPHGAKASVYILAGKHHPISLSPAQVETARQLYGGPVNPRTHQKVYPGLTPGSEFGWDQLTAKPQPPYAPIFQWVFGRDWNWHTFDFDHTADTYQRKLATVVNAMDPSLDAFRRKGHKLVVYHGWADWLVAPGESINFYNQIVAANQNSDDFYRLIVR